MKSPTLADARKLNLVPGVSTILKVLAKPELTNWLIEQAVLSVMTSPRLAGEEPDAFIKRVLGEDKQAGEAAKARDLGTDIHNELERLMSAPSPKPACDPDLAPYIVPAFSWLMER